MGRGKADFGQKGLRMAKTQKFWVSILSLGVLTRGTTWDLHSRLPGPRIAAPWDLDSNLWRCELRILVLSIEMSFGEI